MDQAEQILSYAEQRCKSNGSHLTDKRKQVLSGLLQSQKALSAYELVEVCKAEFDETMPAMSIYRILDFLQKELLVHKLSLANKYVACTHITCDHEHAASQFLIYSECQKVEEISISKATIAGLELTAKQAGFDHVSPQLEMNGVCNHCMATM